MTNALQVIGRAAARPFRSSSMSIDELVSMFSLDSTLFSLNTTMQGDHEDIEGNFVGLVQGAYRRNGVVFACLAARAKLFSEARFQFQQMFGGRTGALFGTPALSILERPEPGVVTGDMLFRASLHADLAGDWFGVRRTLRGSARIKALRPDWTTVVLGSRNPRIEPEAIGWDPDTEVVGYGYVPGGRGSAMAPIAFGAEEVAHYYPNPDPVARYRGMPLIESVLREMLADNSATNHKLAFFRNAATPNIAISLPATMDEEKARKWIQAFEGKHSGALSAYKTLYFGGGMTASVIGANFQQMTFTDLQEHAETRIAAATGMHRVVLALSEGASGSLNGTNFGGVARLVGDVTLRPLWRNMSGSLETIVPPPVPASRLWYDDRDIAFLRADVKDQADVLRTNAETITGLVKEGFTPESAIEAVTSSDMTRLVHTGLISVQLQAPGSTPVAMRAAHDFWAADGPLAQLGPIQKGSELPSDHPMVRAFPSLFVPPAEPAVVISSTSPARRLAAGPAPIVSRAEVLAKKAELKKAGRDAGYDSLAAELGVSRDTVRRRLNGSA